MVDGLPQEKVREQVDTLPALPALTEEGQSRLYIPICLSTFCSEERFSELPPSWREEKDRRQNNSGNSLILGWSLNSVDCIKSHRDTSAG